PLSRTYHYEDHQGAARLLFIIKKQSTIVNITVQEINSVDKEIIVTATREDLNPKFEQALKNIRKKANIPGFRVGMAPMGMIRKRFAAEVEAEEINNYVQE